MENKNHKLKEKVRLHFLYFAPSIRDAKETFSMFQKPCKKTKFASLCTFLLNPLEAENQPSCLQFLARFSLLSNGVTSIASKRWCIDKTSDDLWEIKRGGWQYYIHPRIPQRIITSMLASPFLLTPIKAISSFYHPLITSFPYGAEIIKRMGLGCDNNGCTDIDTICPKPFC